MYTDNNLRVSGSRTATAAAFSGGVPSGYPAGDEVLDDAVSADTVDLSVARELGEGKSLYMVFTVTTAVVRAAGACNVIFSAITSASADLSTPTVLVSSAAIAKADLVVGKQIVLRIPPVIAGAGQRYLGAQYAFDNAADTGNFICDIAETIQDGLKFLASGFAVT